MKHLRYVIFAALFAMTGSTSAHAQLFGPASYEDCLLKHLPGTQSDRAAIFIRRACHKKFPVSCPQGTIPEGRQCAPADDAPTCETPEQTNCWQVVIDPPPEVLKQFGIEPKEAPDQQPLLEVFKDRLP